MADRPDNLRWKFQRDKATKKEARAAERAVPPPIGRAAPPRRPSRRPPPLREHEGDVGAGPVVELRVPKSPSKAFLATRLRAAAFPTYALASDGGFSLLTEPCRLSRFELIEYVEVLGRVCSWKNTKASVNGISTPPVDLWFALTCWIEKRRSATRIQQWHCRPETHRPPRHREVPDVFCAPCRVKRIEAVAWADFARTGEAESTDREGMIAAFLAVAVTHPFAWCPGFLVDPTVVAIRKLPKSREQHRATEQRLREEGEAAWREKMANLSQQLREAREREEDAVWLERKIEIIEGRDTTDSLSPDDFERLATITGVRELGLLGEAASWAYERRIELAHRLRELVLENPPPEDEA